MQIVIAWVVGSPLVAVLVGKMIALGDRHEVAQSRAAIGAITPFGSRFEAGASLVGITETAA